MDKTSYLRYSFLLSDSGATTFNTNLKKLIMLVLAERYGEGLIVHEIVQAIQNKFGIEFTDTEIVSAIRNSNKEILLLEKKDDPVYNRYDLTPKAYEKIHDQDTSVTLKSFVRRFLDASPDVEMEEDKVHDLLVHFFYISFNSNVENILALLNKKDIPLAQDSFDCFQNNEKMVINSFLDWQNQEKDELIYNIISCCYNYCLLTVRKNESSFKDVLKGKVFYLDANIIFRLMGINKEERQNVVQNFIRRCKEMGIKIKYTNVTLGEINNTIEHYVGNIKKWLHQQQPICTDAMRAISGKYANLDFYDQYVRWIRNGNRTGDYTGFIKYLKKIALTAVRDFELDSFSVFNASSQRGKFEGWCRQFKEYKEQRSRAAYEGAIEADINNFMHLLERNQSEGKVSFLEVQNYIITADHYFVNWAREILPNVIPVVVLPSVWYTIILRFFGRTSDDYMAFSQFLHQRLSEKSEVDLRLPALCNKILQLQESASMKEEIAFEVSDKLQTKYRDIEDPDEILQDAMESITERKIKDVEERKSVENLEEQEKLRTEYEKKIMESGSEKYQEGADAGRLEGVQAERERIIRQYAEQETNRIYPWLWIITVLIWLVIILGILGVILCGFLCESPLRDRIVDVSNLIVLFFTVIPIAGAIYIFRVPFCSLNKEKILKKYTQKGEEKFNVQQ